MMPWSWYSQSFSLISFFLIKFWSHSIWIPQNIAKTLHLCRPLLCFFYPCFISFISIKSTASIGTTVATLDSLQTLFYKKKQKNNKQVYDQHFLFLFRNTPMWVPDDLRLHLSLILFSLLLLFLLFVSLLFWSSTCSLSPLSLSLCDYLLSSTLCLRYFSSSLQLQCFLHLRNNSRKPLILWFKTLHKLRELKMKEFFPIKHFPRFEFLRFMPLWFMFTDFIT